MVESNNDENPLKWPSFNLLGADLCHFANDEKQHEFLGKEKCLETLQKWMDSPVCVTVKLDGTNVGMDSEGLLVGRN